MRKCNIRIEDSHFKELHHALGCPWPNEIRGETYRNHFAVSAGSDRAERMSLSPHWTTPKTKFGMIYFNVTEQGKHALWEYIRSNIEVPARYSITFRHREGCTIVSARNRSAAKYAAYLQADIDWPFVEYISEIKSVRLHSAARTPPQPN